MESKRKRIAVIGGGISGLGSAYLLKEEAELTLYEKNSYLGGHSRTLDVEIDGDRIPVDTGFIVFNEKNYPLLTALFDELKVPVVKSDMSFGVSIGNRWLEYASNGLGGLFMSIRNLTNPKMWGLLFDILKFNKKAIQYLKAPPSLSLEDCLDELGMGDWFKKYYLLPMGGAIWSCPLDTMLKFPAASFVRFFNNHGLLSIKDHPQWFSVRGGAREYVKRIMSSLEGKVEIRPEAVEVERIGSLESVMVRDSEGVEKYFDEVIIAAHADEALKMLRNPTTDEQDILGAFQYQPNEVILHTDEEFMPKRRSAWASWVYRSEEINDSNPSISLSYWMNNLQSLNTEVPIIVTLNPSREPAEGTVHNRHSFDHPVFDEAAMHAQGRIMEIQGKNRVWYCGAYQRNGFHEDGLWSAVRIAREMGVNVSWS